MVPSLLTNIKLGKNGLTFSNALAYYSVELATAIKSFIPRDQS
jgi:hypothetical protein